MYAAILIVTALLTATDGTSGSDLVPFEKAEKWGFKDASGKIVVEPKYDQVGAFASGLAPVNLGAVWDGIIFRKRGGKWGYVDAQGKVVVPIKWDYAHNFSDGLGRVLDDPGPPPPISAAVNSGPAHSGMRYFDPSGNVVLELRGEYADDFHEGLASVQEGSLAGKDDRTRFIDKKGRTVLVVDGYAEGFSEGMAVLGVAQKKVDPKVSDEKRLYGYMERSGKIAIPPRFAEARAFHEGLAAVLPKKTMFYGAGDPWGYIDKSGNFVLEPRFNEAHPFHNGVARVHVGGYQPRCCDITPPWRGGEWELVDRLGKVLKRSQKWLEYDDAVKAKPR
jgi:hypothetical protein